MTKKQLIAILSMELGFKDLEMERNQVGGMINFFSIGFDLKIVPRKNPKFINGFKNLNEMDSRLVIANIIVLIALVFHFCWGDKDIQSISPKASEAKKVENWIMARGAFHVVSMDLFIIATVLSLLNFTNLLTSYRTMLLTIMSIYFMLNALVFFIVVAISGPLNK